MSWKRNTSFALCVIFQRFTTIALFVAHAPFISYQVLHCTSYCSTQSKFLNDSMNVFSNCTLCGKMSHLFSIKWHAAVITTASTPPSPPLHALYWNHIPGCPEYCTGILYWNIVLEYCTGILYCNIVLQYCTGIISLSGLNMSNWPHPNLPSPHNSVAKSIGKKEKQITGYQPNKGP